MIEGLPSAEYVEESVDIPALVNTVLEDEDLLQPFLFCYLLQ